MTNADLNNHIGHCYSCSVISSSQAHALRSALGGTGLDEHGHRGTRDQQTDHGEQHGSGGTGERQLGDVLDVGDLEGALVVLGQVPGILTSEGGSSICGCTGSDRELANEGAVVASRDLRLNHGVGGVELKTVQSVLTLSVGLQCVRGAFNG